MSKKSQKNTRRSLEKDLSDNIFIHCKVQENSYAEELYRAFCNVDWRHNDGSEYGCSWRYAGGIVAEIAGYGGNYLDYYCSGEEGNISERIANDLAVLGWKGTAI